MPVNKFMQTRCDRSRINLEMLAVADIALLLFLWGQWHGEFIEFETRFAVFAQEMWRHGISLFPTTYGEPYPDYPSTSTLLIYLAAQPFGGITHFAAILPTACASAISLALLYRLLAPLSRQWAVMAVCLALMTATFVAEARSISLDQMVATIATASFLIAYNFFTYNAAQRSQIANHFFLALLLALGFAIRGPLGVVIPAGIVCSYFALSRQWRQLCIFAVVAIVVLAIGWLGLLALASHWYGPQFAHDVIHMQVAGRLEAGDNHRHWYYFTSSIGNYALAYPIAAVVALVMLPKLRQWHVLGEKEKLVIYLIGWVLIVIAGLSIPDAKKARYLLPIVPAIAAIAAYPFASIDKLELPAWLARSGKVFGFVFAALPLLAAIALTAASHRLHKQAADVHLHKSAIYFLLAVLQVAIVLAYRRLPEQIRQTSIFAFAALAFLVIEIGVVEPVLQQLHDNKTFTLQVEAARAREQAPIAFFRIGKDAAAIKYLVNVDYDLRPIFAKDAVAIDLLPHPFYVVVDDADLPALQQASAMHDAQPIAAGRFDHHKYSAFLIRY